MDRDEKLAKVKCPHCGHEQNVFFKEDAVCNGVFLRCKARHCREIFEIKLEMGK